LNPSGVVLEPDLKNNVTSLLFDIIGLSNLFDPQYRPINGDLTLGPS